MIRMIESTQGSDAAAVERTLAGDPDAYRVLVERHSRNLFRLAYRMTGNEQVASLRSLSRAQILGPGSIESR